ncbi:MAG: hypothetical protein SV062_01630 [Thermodesulfobacteriota bacterium]|nr:hypothetical protein [Thermodesulfobacteriota bacterium]
MIDLLIICRDALLHSYLANLSLAIFGKESGMNVEVMFTQEAAVALVNKNYRISPLLEPYLNKIEELKKKFDFPEDLIGLIEKADKTGVKMFTCTIWSVHMGIREKLPKEIDILEISEVLGKIKDAKKILGTF